MTRKRVFLPLTLAALLLLAAACGDDSSSDDEGGAEASSGEPSAESSGAWPVAIDHIYGSTTIEERPERIVSLNVQWTDVLLSMDVQPAGYLVDESSGETGPYPWQEDLLDDSDEIVQSDNLPLERIASLDPDLILVTYGADDQQTYDQLSEIAPTIAPLQAAEVVDPWQDLTEVAGRFLGEEERARQVVDEVDDQVAAVAEQLPGLEGKTFSLVNYLPDGLTVVADPADGSSVLFQELGMELNPEMQERADDGSGRIQISIEQVSLLDSDLLIVLPNDGDPSADLPGWNDLPAVTDDAYVEMEFNEVVGLNTPTPVSIPFELDLIRPALEAAAA